MDLMRGMFDLTVVPSNNIESPARSALTPLMPFNMALMLVMSLSILDGRILTVYSFHLPSFVQRIMLDRPGF